VDDLSFSRELLALAKELGGVDEKPSIFTIVLVRKGTPLPDRHLGTEDHVIDMRANRLAIVAEVAQDPPVIEPAAQEAK
jgi:hypothetical protein